MKDPMPRGVANDDALKLAHGLRAPLDKMNVKKAG